VHAWRGKKLGNQIRTLCPASGDGKAWPILRTDEQVPGRPDYRENCGSFVFVNAGGKFEQRCLAKL